MLIKVIQWDSNGYEWENVGYKIRKQQPQSSPLISILEAAIITGH